jgi:hypothetical protein
MNRRTVSAAATPERPNWQIVGVRDVDPLPGGSETSGRDGSSLDEPPSASTGSRFQEEKGHSPTPGGYLCAIQRVLHGGSLPRVGLSSRRGMPIWTKDEGSWGHEFYRAHPHLRSGADHEASDRKRTRCDSSGVCSHGCVDRSCNHPCGGLPWENRKLDIQQHGNLHLEPGNRLLTVI